MVLGVDFFGGRSTFGRGAAEKNKSPFLVQTLEVVDDAGANWEKSSEGWW